MRSFELGHLDRNSMLKLTLCRVFFEPFFEARVQDSVIRAVFFSTLNLAFVLSILRGLLEYHHGRNVIFHFELHQWKDIAVSSCPLF